MDGPHLLAYIEQILAPTLKKGDIVFMDNVSTHLVDGAAEWASPTLGNVRMRRYVENIIVTVVVFMVLHLMMTPLWGVPGWRE